MTEASQLSAAFLLSVASVWAHPTFVYTNNNSTVNSVSAFAVGMNGALTTVPGSPFQTGGTGGASVVVPSTQITSTFAKQFLYVTNTKSATISALKIDAQTGKLEPLQGSPFSTGFADIGGLAITPDDQYLIITNGSGAMIAVNRIGADGTPAPVSGSPFRGNQAFIFGANPKVTPDGKFLAVTSVSNIGTGLVSMLEITPGGAVSLVSVSNGNAGAATGIDCNCASSRLYVGADYATGGVPTFAVDAFSIGSTGVLTPIAGSPFFGAGGPSVLLSPSNRKLFASGLSSGISVFDVGPDGSLSVIPGSPFPAGLGTDSIAINKSGRFLYTADVTSHSIFALHIGANGALTPVPGSPFSSGALDGPLGVTVYPPKTCCPAPEVSEVSASPNVLWPPNSNLVEVAIDYTVSGENSDVGDDGHAGGHVVDVGEDGSGQALACPNTCVLTVSSNEPPPGAANGTSSADWKVVDAHHVLLRAQRAGNGNGRVYTITITCTNNSNGLASNRTVTVRVPHDQGD